MLTATSGISLAGSGAPKRPGFTKLAPIRVGHTAWTRARRAS
jgi:hypothetical protein